MSLLITSDIYRKETTMVPSINYHFPTGSNDNFKCISCGLPLCTFFHIRSILNIKTCSFQFHFPSVFMPAKKTSVHFSFFSSNFTVENAFVYTASKTLVSVQIPMKKIEMTVLRKKRKKRIPS